MINLTDLRDIIVHPVLKGLGMYSLSAERLVLGTALAEGIIDGETRLKQVRGPALGIYQMEPATHDDIWGNYLRYNKDLIKKVRTVSYTDECFSHVLPSNLRYATAMCRVHYFRRPEGLPHEDDFYGLAAYWKKHYNTEKGKGTIQGFMDKAKAIYEI